MISKIWTDFFKLHLLKQSHLLVKDLFMALTSLKVNFVIMYNSIFYFWGKKNTSNWYRKQWKIFSVPFWCNKAALWLCTKENLKMPFLVFFFFTIVFGKLFWELFYKMLGINDSFLYKHFSLYTFIQVKWKILVNFKNYQILS